MLIFLLGTLLRFLSTLSLRRATLRPYLLGDHHHISIHALLAESDPLKNAITAAPQQISIHALLAESDRSNQSIISQANNFYPRSPCGERQRANSLPHAPPHISIHALLAESDFVFWTALNHLLRFLSTLSLRRATSLLTLCPFLLCRFLSTLSLRRATFACIGFH